MSAKFANLGVGCLNLLVGALSPYLMAHFNRRTLCLISCSLCALNMFGVAMIIHFIVSRNHVQRVGLADI